MTTLSLTDPVNGTSNDASVIASNNAAVKSVVNGGIDAGNITDGSITNAKITDGTITNAKIAASGIVGTKLLGARVAATVGGLGTTGDGALGFIRAGSTPFSFVALVYDATYGKWVSPDFSLGPLASSSLSTSSSTFQEGGNQLSRWVPWKTLDTAGLKPQLRLMAELALSGGAGAAEVRLAVEPTNLASVVAASVAVTTTLISVAPGVTGKVYDSGFGVFPATAVTDLFRVNVQYRSSDGTNTVTVRDATAYLRWTS